MRTVPARSGTPLVALMSASFAIQENQFTIVQTLKTTQRRADIHHSPLSVSIYISLHGMRSARQPITCPSRIASFPILPASFARHFDFISSLLLSLFFFLLSLYLFIPPPSPCPSSVAARTSLHLRPLLHSVPLRISCLIPLASSISTAVSPSPLPRTPLLSRCLSLILRPRSPRFLVAHSPSDDLKFSTLRPRPRPPSPLRQLPPPPTPPPFHRYGLLLQLQLQTLHRC